MSARDSGYGEPWNRNRAMAQPTPINIPFSPLDASKQSQPLQSHQYHFQTQSYRDHCGTSVSARESLPEYSSQTPLDEVHDQDFSTQIEFPPTNDLAGLDHPEGNLFDLNPLTLNSAFDSMSPNTSRYPDFPLSALNPDFPLLDNDPWNEYRNLPPNNNNIMPEQLQPYARSSTNKRRRLESDSGIGTQHSSPSSGFMPPHDQMRYSAPNNPHLYSSTPVTALQDDTASPYRQRDQQLGPATVSTRRNKSPSLSQQSPSQSNSKAQRKSTEKHICTLCGPDKVTSCNTINDLNRHIKGVHGVLTKGDKVWQCTVNGCTCGNKIWPRRDNFQQHLKRMHYGGNEGQARDNIDSFEITYDPETHSDPDQVNTGKGGAQPSRSIHHFSPPTRPVKHASVPDTSTVQSAFMGNMTDTRPGMFNRFDDSLASVVSESRIGQRTNRGKRTHDALSGINDHTTTAAVPSQVSQVPRPGGRAKNMGRPGLALTAPPNSDSWMRQQREIQDQEQATLQFSHDGPSLQDFSSVGQAFGFVQSATRTIDPSLISTAGFHEQEIDLNAASGESEPSLYPRKDLDDMLKALKSLTPEDRARLFNRVEQIDESDQVQGFSKRSVSKPSTKKKADGEKTLKCNIMVKKKGAKEKNLIPCPASFSLHSELRKHRKRHDKRFGCTFDTCFSKFGTKWEWKRHEQSQHIQNMAWRCRCQDGEIGCQKLFNDQNRFEDHLAQQHLCTLDSKEMEKEVEECHLRKKWLGSYWCGYCRRVVQSQKEVGRERVNERFEHIGAHIIVQGSKSADWIELAAEGKSKGQMKEIKDSVGRSASRSNQVDAQKRQSQHEMEEEEGEQDDNDGDDSDGLEYTDTDESNSPAELQRPRPKPPTLDTLTAQNSSIPSSFHGSHTGPSSITPTIHAYTPDGLRMADHMLGEMNRRPMQRQRAHSESNPAGYLAQQDRQVQSRPHLEPQAQPLSQPEQNHTPSRCCCVCRRTSWGGYQDSCEYQDCQHKCGPYCSYPAPQGNFIGSFPNDDDASFSYYSIGV